MRKIIFMLFGMLLLCACEKEGDLFVRDHKDSSLLSGEENDRKGDQVLGYEKIKEHWVNVDDVNICYTKNGRGKEVIVFVHGVTANKEYWIGQNEFFCDKAKIIMIDLPGHGKSDAPTIDYTMDFYAKAVLAVMQKAGAHNAILVSHSLGLAIGRELVFENPGLIKKMVNIDGAIFYYPPEGDPARQGFVEFVNWLNYNFANPTDEFLIWFASLSFGPNTPDYMKEKRFEVMLSFPSYVIASTMYHLTREEIWEFKPWNTPVLSIYRADPNYAVEEGLLPGSQVEIIEGSGHAINLEYPDEVNQLIDEFIFNDL